MQSEKLSKINEVRFERRTMWDAIKKVGPQITQLSDEVFGLKHAISIILVVFFVGLVYGIMKLGSVVMLQQQSYTGQVFHTVESVTTPVIITCPVLKPKCVRHTPATGASTGSSPLSHK